MNATKNTRNKEAELAGEIRGSRSSSEVVSTVLKTDEKVLARVTDGIYRQPGSALRELVANAYDADAREVVIQTDRPRFERISVQDNGLGMSPEALAHLLHHIGGSAKRSHHGVELGLADAENPDQSPGGRKLIGKIGIGLFSVAQLTQSFQIVTKTAGESFRTVATVALKQFSDEFAGDTGEGEEYEAGAVRIWREPASDTDEHGTTIVLTDVRPQTRDTLRSAGVWESIELNETLSEESEHQDISPPRFHIGRVVVDNEAHLRVEGERLDAVPWDDDNSPSEAFHQLVMSVWDQLSHGTPNPRLERIFDYYLRMVWELSLAMPLPYVEGHPFDIPFGNTVMAYDMSRVQTQPPTPIELGSGETLRGKLSLGKAVPEDPQMRIIVDDLELSRPVRFRDLPTTSHAIEKPILMVGDYREEFQGIDAELSGGPLTFQAFMLWNPKIVPTEHQGVLVRIHGSSGTGFDPTFMRYQVSEQTRLRQICCEIFVTQGLEGALNIDRESFNYAHPHAVYLTKWLHDALRRFATEHKRLGAEIRSTSRQRQREAAHEKVDSLILETWAEQTGDPDMPPPSISFESEDELETEKVDGYRFSRRDVIGSTEEARGREQLRERQLKAIAQVLAAFDLLEDLTPERQAQLLKSIRQVLDALES